MVKFKKVVPIVVLILCILVPITLTFIESSKDKSITIFENISECESLSSLKTDKNIPEDRYISDLTYENSYVYKMKLNSHNFKIFAYEFKSIEDAKNYYFEVKGINVEEDYCYNISSGMGFGMPSEMIVMNDKNVYRIECHNPWALNDICDYLKTVFSVDMKDVR